MMLESHEQAKLYGEVRTIFGRPRRMPEAMSIPKGIAHAELPYEQRSLLNLAMNHRVQGAAASIMNRAAIACHNVIGLLAVDDHLWRKVRIVLQVHDELVLKGPTELAEDMAIILKDSLENSVELPGVRLIADPKIAYTLADLK